MDIEPIEITIDDLRTFAQVVSLVDKPEFIEKSSQLRKKYLVEQPLKVSIESICKHFVKLVSDTEVKVKSIPEPNSKGFLHLFSYPDRLLDYLIEHNDYPDKKLDESIKSNQKQFFDEVKQLRNALSYPPMFDGVILQSILFSKIFVFATAQPHIFNDPPHPHESVDKRIKRTALMAIIVTPNSTPDDIKTAYETIQTDYALLLGSEYPAYQPLPKDTITNIKRDRTWYWRIQQGMSYKQIAIEENGGKQQYEKAVKIEENVTDYPEQVVVKASRHIDFIDSQSETIRKAVKRYKKLLTAI